MEWWQFAGAFLTGSGGGAVVNAWTQQRRSGRLERRQAERDQTLDRQRLFQEASDLIVGMRREIDRLRQEVAGVRSECESRQGRLQDQVQRMYRELAYWQQVSGELRRDNAQLRDEVTRLQARVKELEQSNEQQQPSPVGA